MKKPKHTIAVPTESKQLKSMTIIVSMVDDPDPAETSPYAATNVYRYDLVGSTQDFIQAMEQLKDQKGKNFIVAGGQMGNL